MAERKVLVKYYPPDFDRTKIPRLRMGKKEDFRYTIRFMLPMSVICSTCGNFCYMGTKYNAKKETLAEKYLTLEIYRFYIRCSRCSGEMVIRTDPKNSEYLAEKGCVRTHDQWRKSKKAEEEEEEAKKAEVESDIMKQLDEKTKGTAEELDILDTLDELRSLNARQASVNTDALLTAARRLRPEEEAAAKLRALEEAEDRRLAEEAFAYLKGNISGDDSSTIEDGEEEPMFIKRLNDEDEDEEDEDKDKDKDKAKSKTNNATNEHNSKKRSLLILNDGPRLKKKAKSGLSALSALSGIGHNIGTTIKISKKNEKNEKNEQITSNSNNNNNNNNNNHATKKQGIGSLVAYGDDEEESSSDSSSD